MATWKISNLEQKTVMERQFWVRDGVVVIRDEWFRWGEWICTSPVKPVVDLNPADGFNLFAQTEDWEVVELGDGDGDDWTFPQDMAAGDRERFESQWEEDWDEGIESDGWYNQRSEHWIFGPIELVNEDTGEAWRGEPRDEKGD